MKIRKSTSIFYSATLALMTVTFAISACKKKDENPNAQSQSTSSLVQRSERVPAMFDTIGHALAIDINGDGLTDTIKSVHVQAPEKIKSTFSLTIPEKADLAEADTFSNWGLLVLLGDTNSPRKKDSLFFPGIAGVIYDQGDPDIVRADTSSNMEMQKLKKAGIRMMVSLFTQSGASIYLYETQGKYRVYWPSEESGD